MASSNLHRYVFYPFLMTLMLATLTACGSVSGPFWPSNPPPSTPTNLVARAVSPSQVDLTWNASTDNSGFPPSYEVYRNGTPLSWMHISGTSSSDTMLDPGATYCYTVIAFDNQGLESAFSNQTCVTMPADTVPPNTPTNLTATLDPLNVGLLQIALSWTASTDNGYVKGYRILRDGVFLKNSGYPDCTDDSVSPLTRYCYQITAFDEAGNVSAPSNQACVTTTGRIEILDSDGDTGRYPSLAFDSGGGAHISYYYSEYLGAYDHIGSLKYITNSTGAWSRSTIDSEGDVGVESSLDLDSSDKVHISYFDASNFHLKYATNISGGWVTDTVDNSLNSGYFSSLAARPGMGVHISYRDATQSIWYETNISGTWVSEKVGSAGAGAGTSLKIDATGKVHISYRDGTILPGSEISGVLKYATNVSGTWSVTTIDNGSDTGWYPSLAVDAVGNVHISYYDEANHSLRYATNATGAWQNFTIDNAGDVGTGSAIAVDSANGIHISYVDAVNHYLKYATNTDGTWKLYVLDSVAWVAGNTSIALDRNGQIHIAYRGNATLRYATNR